MPGELATESGLEDKLEPAPISFGPESSLRGRRVRPIDKERG
jgi:hypothetical protein